MIRPLLRFATAASCAALLLILPSCLKSSNKTVLNKDGTGTATISATFDMEKLNSLKEMMKGMMGGGEPGAGAPKEESPMDDFDPEKIKKQLEGKKGVTLVSATKTEAPDKKSTTFKLEFKFDSLQAFYESGAAQVEPGAKVALAEADGTWTLSHEGKGGPGGEGDAPPEMMAMVAPFLEGLEIVTTYELPGEITETNGTKSEDGHSVTWKVTSANMMKPEARKQSVKFTGEELALKAFSFTGAPKADGIDAPKPPEGEKPAEGGK